jgi:hypothetical protein
MYVNRLFKFVFMQNSTELCTNKIKYAMKNAVVNEKKAKRPYVKKRLRTQDELWKSIISTLWASLVRFCLADWVDKIDFTRNPVFLDKELKRLMLRAKSKNRIVDVLMRIYLKDGTDQLFLLHIEVQGYHDPEFEQRVEYHYRISDLLKEPLETLAILIDDDPLWRPCEYRQVCGQTKILFEFRMFKLLDNPPPYARKEDNPFSVVFEVAWHGLKQNMLKNDQDLMALKFRLIRRLLENNIDTATIYDLLEFINIYLPFKKPEKSITFDRKIELIIDKDKNMEARTRTMDELYREFLGETFRKIARKEFNLEFKDERKAIRDERNAFKDERKVAKEKLEKLEAKRLEAEKQRLEAEAKRLEAEKQRLEAEKQRLEAEKQRLEAEKRLVILVRKLYSQGSSIESIADTMGQPVAFVQEIIEGKEVAA